jgi:hypothetical protein
MDLLNEQSKMQIVVQKNVIYFEYFVCGDLKMGYDLTRHFHLNIVFICEHVKYAVCQ